MPQRSLELTLDKLPSDATSSYTNLCLYAAKVGNIRILEYLFQEIDVTSSVATLSMKTAIEFGHLDVIKCLRQHGFPWYSHTCEDAAMFKRMDILQWAYDNMCTYTDGVWRNALKNGDLDIFAWAIDHGSPYEREDLLQNVTMMGHQHISEWLACEVGIAAN